MWFSRQPPCYYFEWQERREWFERLHHFNRYFCDCTIVSRHAETNRLTEVTFRTTELDKFEAKVAETLGGVVPAPTAVIKAQTSYKEDIRATLPPIKDWSKLPANPPESTKPEKLERYALGFIGWIGCELDTSGFEMAWYPAKPLNEEDRIPVEWYPYVLQKVYESYAIQGMAYIPSEKCIYISVAHYGTKDSATALMVLDGRSVDKRGPAFNIDEGFYWPNSSTDPIADEMVMAYEDWLEGDRDPKKPVLRLLEDYSKMSQSPLGP